MRDSGSGDRSSSFGELRICYMKYRGLRYWGLTPCRVTAVRAAMLEALDCLQQSPHQVGRCEQPVSCHHLHVSFCY